MSASPALVSQMSPVRPLTMPITITFFVAAIAALTSASLGFLSPGVARAAAATTLPVVALHKFRHLVGKSVRGDLL